MFGDMRQGFDARIMVEETMPTTSSKYATGIKSRFQLRALAQEVRKQRIEIAHNRPLHVIVLKPEFPAIA